MLLRIAVLVVLLAGLSACNDNDNISVPGATLAADNTGHAGAPDAPDESDDPDAPDGSNGSDGSDEANTSDGSDSSPGPEQGRGGIQVLSNRADLVSGGNALIKISAEEPEDINGATVILGGTDVTSMLEPVDDALEGVVTGLDEGDNTLTVQLADGSILTRHIINHPIGGPVFSGPQIQPWNCTNEDVAEDTQCNQPPEYQFKYVPAQRLAALITDFDPQNPQLPPAFESYDPDNPPPDDRIADVTTDEGVTVPFIVRVEKGVLNRDRYQIMTLYRPGESWTALHPQEQWNHKLLIHHGGNVGVSYGMGEPPNGDLAGTLPAGTEVLLGDSITVALGRGFMTMSTAQDNLGHNENPVTAAESLMMTKERIIEQYGTLRYTIGTGCSGGSITQQHVANTYPGIYQGLIVQCSFPDVWTTATQFAEYNILNHYFGIAVPSDAEGLAKFLGALSVKPGLVPLIGFYGNLPINPVVSDLAFFPSARPHQDDCPKLEDQTQVFDVDNNPTGLRCGLLDYMINQFAEQPQAEWTPAEQQYAGAHQGVGYAGIPLDNVGVQYGLKTLQLGLISGQKFLDVNEGVGGLDVNIDYQAERTRADDQSLKNAYRTGAINTAEHMANVPIIDLRGPDPGLAHDAFRSWVMRARLQKTQGYSDNQVIWYGPIPLAGDTTYTTQALVVMDRWLSNIESDDSTDSVEQKIRTDRPARARDRCLSISSLTDAEHIVPLTGDLFYPEPTLTGVDLSKLPVESPKTGKILDAATHQVCGLDLEKILDVSDLLDPPADGPLSELFGPLSGLLGGVGGVTTAVNDLLKPVTDVIADLQNTVVETRFGTPRTLAGDDVTTLTNKCQLKPVDPADYENAPGVLDANAFADKVRQIFPDGVCDFSKPPVDQVHTVPWLQYGTADKVIYGGEPLSGDHAGNSRQGWASPSFQVGIEAHEE